MRIVQITSSEKFSEDYDYRSLLIIKVDGEEKINFLDGEPEDSNLSRGFNDAYSIVGLLEAAHKAGKEGQELVIANEKVDDFEY